MWLSQLDPDIFTAKQQEKRYKYLKESTSALQSFKVIQRMHVEKISENR